MLPQTIVEAARRFGDRTAYVAPDGRPLSYADIDRISDEAAVGLAVRGVRAGDVVALVLPPGIEYLLAYCAAAKIGAITTGVNDRLSPREREAVLTVAEPVLTLNDAHELDDLRVADSAPPALAPDSERPVAIIFTSGTTGLPKGALYCNRQLEFITQTDVGDAWDGGGRSYSGTSYAHLGFMTKLPGALRRGGTNFIMERWHAHAALELIAREQMSTVAGVPTQLALMLRDPEFDTFDLTSVQYIISGGGPITPDLAAKHGRASAQNSRLATRAPKRASGSARRSTTPKKTRSSASAVRMPASSSPCATKTDTKSSAGAIGEVCLRSPAVMSGYWHDDEQTAAAFTIDRFVRTGDLGWVDDRGRLRLVGRAQGDVRARWLQRLSGRGRGRALEACRCRRRRGRTTRR